jgi:antibiotic biosynthesis monooxygenase (ABM) superfamily enzyme
MSRTADGDSSDDEIDVVVSRVVRTDREDRFREWVARVEREISQFPGLLAFKAIEPRRGLQDEFVVVNRWANAAAVFQWENSEKRRQLFAEADQISERPGGVQHVSGMQGVFTLPETRLSVAPAKYKMALIIFTGLFLLTLGWSTLAGDLLAPLPIVVRTAIIVAINVCVMVYLVLPAATRVLLRWLA